MKIAINGFGRIGRTAFRVWYEKHQDRALVVAINTSGSMDLEGWAHLLKYDSNYGVWNVDMRTESHQSAKQTTDEDPLLGYLVFGPVKVAVLAQRDPAKLPWKALGVDTVIESTGVFTSQEKATLHLQAGAARVIISAPPKGSGIKTYVLGVNEQTGESHPQEQIDSNASCTTNCVGPVAAMMHETFGVQKAMMSTVHAYTDDQSLQDASHHDLRRARAAAKNIVPTTTGAAISVTETIPELKGLFDGISYRVPVSVGSISDIVFLLKKKTTVEEINSVFIAVMDKPRWRGILAVTNEPLVSSDIVGRSESSIVDLSLTQVIDGDLVRIVAWYDNEWGYCNRLIEQAVLMT